MTQTPKEATMTAQTPTVPDGYMMNAKGALIPEANVKPADKLEDEVVRDLIARAKALRADLRAFKVDALSSAETFRRLIAEQYGATKGGAKGNMTLSAFDGSAQVKVQISEHLAFGAELAAAKELIDDCITRWADGSNDNLRALIDQAFQVGKEGRIDTGRVLGLRKLDIKGPDGGKDQVWERAMEAISDAVRVTGSRTYVRFYEAGPSGEMVPVSLDLAAL
jgi:hypothetical protein